MTSDSIANKRFSFLARWRISPLEIAAMAAFIILTLGGLFFSVEDAFQLEQTINLDLTQTLIVTQGIVNLQREILLTHGEVLRLLGGLDQPPVPVSRYPFVEIQVNNLATEVQSPSIKLIFSDEDFSLVKNIQSESDSVKQLIADSQQTTNPETRRADLLALDIQLDTMETTVKRLIDRQAITQRAAIVETNDSLVASQRTSLLAGVIVLLMGLALAAIFRRTLIARLQQAVEADRLKGQLLANVSHELRTPLNAIQGYAQLLGEEAYGALSEGQRNTIQRIRLNTTQLQGMVNNLLDRAQLEQGKLGLRTAPFSPAELIETTQTALSILASTKGLELAGEVAPDVPVRLMGDEIRLQQILLNLTSNAIKFTEHGTVQVRIFLADPAHWALQVSDTGIGMPPEAQEHVFEAFWQIDSTATRRHRGSGLGLSIVKQLADLMGAEIKVSSQPGQGSTFTLVFPLEVAN